jgi:alpha/beta superfamily hydrolase
VCSSADPLSCRTKAAAREFKENPKTLTAILHYLLWHRAGTHAAGEKSGDATKAERFFIPGPAGRLEAVLEFEPKARARATALVCHPHPLYGGDMRNKVVYRATKAALEAGLPTLRFNFRGVGKSQGEFAKGLGERDDAHAALDLLAGRFPGLPVVMIGFSFGAVVGLIAGAADPRVGALVGLGVPAGSADLSFLRDVSKPKLIVQGTEDIFGPREEVEALFAALAEPKLLHWVEGADHFFTGKLDEVQTTLREFLTIRL